MNRAVSKWLSTVEPTHTELYEGTKQVSESGKGKAKYYLYTHVCLRIQDAFDVSYSMKIMTWKKILWLVIQNDVRTRSCHIKHSRRPMI